MGFLQIYNERHKYTRRIISSFNSTFQIKVKLRKILKALSFALLFRRTNSFSEAIRKYLNLEPIIVSPGIKTGLKVNIDNPKELGPIELQIQ